MNDEQPIDGIRQSNVTRAVRQILMNELGLTRELIRAEVVKIVAEEVTKLVPMILGNVERLARVEFDKRLGGTQWGSGGFAKLIHDELKAQTERLVANRLKIELLPVEASET